MGQDKSVEWTQETSVTGSTANGEPTVRYLEQAEKCRSRELWEEAFPEDSRSFDDYYFHEKLKDNRILALEQDGQINAMIHLNPYLVQVRDRRWRIDYLVGVATRKMCRHRGYMRRLLMKMMKDMRAENVPFCFLMPAAEAIYRPFGFTYIFDQPKWGWRKEYAALTRREVLAEKGRPPADHEKLRSHDPNLSAEKQGIWPDQYEFEKFSAWMNGWLADRYEVYAVRDPHYLKRLLKEIASENGTFQAVCDGEKMVGFESEWGLGAREQRLLYGVPAYTRETGIPKPAIMARIISAEDFVRAIHLQETVKEDEVVLPLHLTDPLIPENDGDWSWHITHETSWLERREDIMNTASNDKGYADTALELTITELTGWLFGYNIPDAAVPFMGVVQPLQGVFLDEVV